MVGSPSTRTWCAASIGTGDPRRPVTSSVRRPATIAGSSRIAPGAEDDARRRGELEAARRAHGAVTASSGKTARYFVLERGSAISGATASRQAA